MGTFRIEVYSRYRYANLLGSRTRNFDPPNRNKDDYLYTTTFGSSQIVTILFAFHLMEINVKLAI
jgi:hypothetical protein